LPLASTADGAPHKLDAIASIVEGDDGVASLIETASHGHNAIATVGVKTEQDALIAYLQVLGTAVKNKY
jgi:cbb3-type cytochrome oxidase cytochrome c subunit